MRSRQRDFGLVSWGEERSACDLSGLEEPLNRSIHFIEDPVMPCLPWVERMTLRPKRATASLQSLLRLSRLVLSTSEPEGNTSRGNLPVFIILVAEFSLGV